MRTRMAPIVLAALVMGLLVGIAKGGDSDRIMSGEYVSAFQSGRRPLKAVLTPAGVDTWDVVFHFKFHGRAHEFSGSAEGSLDEVALSGTVENEGKQRTFSFQGTFREGKFHGTHAEVKRTGERRTGSLTLVEQD